ncbi:hypothetical protein [Streptomyces sp. JW3]|uniref:hypothetical protein n=1 Tax=Streptomyces sp. JW3 TaxID=3456955 RepID=UPI003FA49021
MSASQTPGRPLPSPAPTVPMRVPMRDLLASCAAAHLISTPPPAPEPEPRRSAPEHREAA